MQKHDWRTVTVSLPGMYSEGGPTVVEWCYKLENEGWEIAGVFPSIGGDPYEANGPTILCRRPFIPATIRNEAPSSTEVSNGRAGKQRST